MLKVLAGLRVYKGQLDQAITALDRLARQRGEKRGRSPDAPAHTAPPVAAKRRKRKPPQAASRPTS